MGAISRITKTKHKNNTEFFTEKKHNIFPETRDPAVWLRVHALDSRLSAHRAQEILRLRHRFGYFWIPLIFRWATRCICYPCAPALRVGKTFVALNHIQTSIETSKPFSFFLTPAVTPANSYFLRSINTCWKRFWASNRWRSMCRRSPRNSGMDCGGTFKTWK